jgi:hypothetical protein
MQKIGIHSIEDCIEILTGLQKHTLTFTIKPSDVAVINSIARQVFKGVALTDKQYALMKAKLLEYKSQFDDNDIIGFDRALTKLRNELRTIDRSKIITVSERPTDIAYQEYLQGDFIKIRFPFAKSLIVKVESIAQKHKNIYFHHKGSHEHYFYMTENTIFDVVNTFKESAFVIDEFLIDTYNQIKTIKNNSCDYIPGIYSNQFKNINSKVLKLIHNDLGNLDNNSFIKFVDRRRRYGYVVFDTVEHDNSLLHEIVCRDDTIYLAKPSQHNMPQLVETIQTLDRFPLLVVLDETSADKALEECINTFNVDPADQTCLFRLDGEHRFNQLIKQNNLNNWLDNSKKIVYISAKKLPKLLLKESWKPIATLAFTSSIDRQVSTFIGETSDLIIFREEAISPLRLNSKYYANY